MYTSLTAARREVHMSLISLAINVYLERVSKQGDDPALGQVVAVVNHEHPVHGHTDKQAAVPLNQNGGRDVVVGADAAAQVGHDV